MLERVSISPTPIINLEAFKAFLRIDHSGEDSYLQELIKSATEWVEQELGRSILDQVWQKTHYPREMTSTSALEYPSLTIIDLNYPPVQEILSITRLTNPPQPIKRYTLNRQYSMPRLTLGYCDTPVCIVYRCGYLDPPAPLKQAIQHIAATLYNQPEGHAKIKDPFVQDLLNPFRIRRFT